MPRSTNVLLILIVTLLTGPAFAAECTLEDRACIIKSLQDEAGKIETGSWRDQTYRELAKTLAFDGRTDEAIALIPKIENPDTKAMTIRGIGMAAADNKLKAEQYNDIFQKLSDEAAKIDHEASHAIALTYIAMAQAFAGDNTGAWKTAAGMENEALRHKAYAETAEIQAEKGDSASAMKSIELIGSTAFKNKAYGTVSRILADQKQLESALKAAQKITNPYKKAEALQYVLDVQKPREIPHLTDKKTGTEP